MQEERVKTRRDYDTLVSELSSILHVDDETVSLKHSVTLPLYTRCLKKVP